MGKRTVNREIPSKTPDFKVRGWEREVIDTIVERAMEMFSEQEIKYSKVDLTMDIIAVHKNIVELRLEELRDADDFNFSHDIYGIMNCLDRRTIELKNHFLPRFSRHEELS